MINLDLYFPTPVWWSDLDINHSAIAWHVFDQWKVDPEGRTVSNYHGWQSQAYSGDEIPVIKNAALTMADRVKVDMGLHPDTKFKFDSAWSNINGDYAGNQVHIHHGAFLSGVYYAQSDENCGDIVFYKDFNRQYMKTTQTEIVEHTPLTGDVVRYPPKCGRMFVFPGWLPHSVDPNSIDSTERISIAFNILIHEGNLQ